MRILHLLIYCALSLAIKSLTPEEATLLQEYEDKSSKSDLGYAPLHCAVEDKNEPAVKLIIAQKHNLNAITKKTATALHIAAEKGQAAIVKELINAGANVNAITAAGFTAFHFAAEHGRLEVAKELIDACDKIDASSTAPAYRTATRTLVNAQTEDGYTALHIAAEYSRAEIIKPLIDAGIDVNIVARNGQTALHKASVEGKPEIIKALIDAETNVNAQDNNGWTAMHCAADKNRIGVAWALLDAGARWDVKCATDRQWQPYSVEEEYTPLNLAKKNGHAEMINLLEMYPKLHELYANDSELSEFSDAVRTKNIRQVQKLIDTDDIKDYPSYYGNIALHFAVFVNSPAITAILPEDPEAIVAKNRRDQSPLMLAQKMPRATITQLLINIVMRDPAKGLYLLASNGETDALRLVKDRINSVDSSNNTALHMAIENGNVNAAINLIQQEIDTTLKNIYGKTAFNLAEHNQDLLRRINY